MNIDQLLDFMHQIYPLSYRFRETLKRVMGPPRWRYKNELNDYSGRTDGAYFLLEGICTASMLNELGKEVVVGIMLPRIIFTDLDSFLHEKETKIKLRSIGEVSLQCISRTDFLNEMNAFEETALLRERIILAEFYRAQDRALLISMNKDKRFESFCMQFPMDQIPNHIGASYLNMSDSDYSKLKAAWNSKGSAPAREL